MNISRTSSTVPRHASAVLLDQKKLIESVLIAQAWSGIGSGTRLNVDKRRP